HGGSGTRPLAERGDYRPRETAPRLALTGRVDSGSLSGTPAPERRHGRAPGLHALPAEDHQALLRQPGDAPAPAAGRAGERTLPERGEEARPGGGVPRRRHAEARRAAVADRPPAPAGQPGPGGPARQGTARVAAGERGASAPRWRDVTPPRARCAG